MGQKQKTEKREREKERNLVKTMAKLRMAHASTHGARMAHASTHGARKHAWRTQAAWAKISLQTENHLPRCHGSGLKVGRWLWCEPNLVIFLGVCALDLDQTD